METRPTLGMWCTLGDSATTTRLARAGYDWMVLDAQHGALDRARIIEILRHRSETWSRVLVRVPSLDAAEIGAALDAGADGVVVPMIGSAAEARAAVAAALYPPLGRRSWGPLTPLWGRDAPAAPAANEQVEVWAMVETPEALEEVDAIAAVPGITSVFVGPYDLALSLGTSVDDLLAAPDDDAPLRRILAACRRAGIRCGAFGGDPAKAMHLMELGFDDVAAATDAGAVDHGAAALLNDVSPTPRRVSG